MQPRNRFPEALRPAFAVAILHLFLPATGAFALRGQTDVLTSNYDNLRSNSNRNEKSLRPGTVSPELFGKLYSLPVDGQVYAQPLVINGVDVAGYGIRNLVIVATTRNSVYAFDADPQGSQVPLWKAQLGTPVPTANYSIGAYFDDLLPFNGILSTPVIDAATKTLYAVAATYEAGAYAYKLHAIDLTTGRNRKDPVEIAGELEGKGSVDDSGIVRFDPFWHLQRPGLLLANGNVYIAFGSHGGLGPYHGWIFAYSASDIHRQVGMFNVTPDDTGSAVWMSGRGVAADESGSIYASTGNGPFNGIRNFGESVLKLDPNLVLQSWFTPDNFEELTAIDNDLGACGPLLVPGANVLVVGGKTGTLYVLNRGELGQVTPGNTGAVQVMQPVAANTYNLAAWQRNDGTLLYVPGAWEPVQALRLSHGQFEPQPVSRAQTGAGIPYYGMAVSSDGDDPSSGILWMTSTESGYTGRAWPGVLRAFDANNLEVELWNSGLDPEDALPSYAKFATPTVANGLVFVPTFSNQVVVYGPKSSRQNMDREIRVSNAYSLSGGAVSPGELLAVEGAGLGPEEPVRATPWESLDLPRSLGRVQVLFDGQPAPLVEVSAGRILAVAPYSVLSTDGVVVEVGYAGTLSKPLPIGVANVHPGLQTIDGTGMGGGAFLNEDGTPNRPDNPALLGSVVSIQVTGVGPTEPQSEGFVRPEADDSTVPRATLPVEVNVWGIQSEFLSLAAEPFRLASTLTLRFRLPEWAPEDPRVPVVVRIGDATAPAVTISLKAPPRSE